MAEICAHCAASFGCPADLIEHVRKRHPEAGPRTTLAMNPESRRPGLVCALCGRRFGNPDALTRHMLAPHPPTTGPAARIPSHLYRTG